MRSLALIFWIVYSLLFAFFATPTEHIPTVAISKVTNPLRRSFAKSPILVLAQDLNTTVTSRPFPTCGRDDPDPTENANPISNPADCPQAVLKMFYGGDAGALLVWDRQQTWEYASCSLQIVPVPELPIHRDTFSRTDIADCAESIRLVCMKQGHVYRGGTVPIAAGVFQVGLFGLSQLPKRMDGGRMRGIKTSGFYQ